MSNQTDTIITARPESQARISPPVPSAEGYIRALLRSRRISAVPPLWATPSSRELDLLEARVFNLMVQDGSELLSWVSSRLARTRPGSSRARSSSPKNDETHKLLQMYQTLEDLTKHCQKLSLQVSNLASSQQ